MAAITSLEHTGLESCCFRSMLAHMTCICHVSFDRLEHLTSFSHNEPRKTHKLTHQILIEAPATQLLAPSHLFSRTLQSSLCAIFSICLDYLQSLVYIF